MKGKGWWKRDPQWECALIIQLKRTAGYRNENIKQWNCKHIKCAAVDNAEIYDCETNIMQWVAPLSKFAYSSKCCVIIWPKYAPRHIPKRIESIYLHTNFYMNVHSSIIHDDQKVETAIVFNWWMNF